MTRNATRVITVPHHLRQEQKSCAMCGAAFWGVPTRCYCSRVCQNKSYWQRHAEQLKRRRQKAHKWKLSA